MALSDDIMALPETIGDGRTGHLGNHQIIHRGLKDHEERLGSHRHPSSGITDAVFALGSVPDRLLRTNGDGKISVPTASITGQSDPTNKAYVDAGDAAAGAGFFFKGTGSPEGKTAAPVGAIYVDTAVTNGAVRWVKATGTGTTGWLATGGDTGLRNIAGLLSAYTSDTGGVTLERMGSAVQMNFYARRFDVKGAGADDVLFTLPDGFRPTTTYRTYMQQPSTVQIQVATNGVVSIIGGQVAQGGYTTFGFSHLTRNPWPTTRPGTPN